MNSSIWDHIIILGVIVPLIVILFIMLSKDKKSRHVPPPAPKIIYSIGGK